MSGFLRPQEVETYGSTFEQVFQAQTKGLAVR
jgi:hypothetical protein